MQVLTPAISDALLERVERVQGGVVLKQVQHVLDLLAALLVMLGRHETWCGEAYRTSRDVCRPPGDAPKARDRVTVLGEARQVLVLSVGMDIHGVHFDVCFVMGQRREG